MIEELELTPCHVGQRHLGEAALMDIFATVQAHRISAATNRPLNELTDAQGRRLYPSFYWTHLRVPPTHLLERYRTWDRIAVAVEVHRHGSMLLDSIAVLGRPGALGRDSPCGDPDRIDGLPHMRAGNLFILDDSRSEPQASAPAPENLVGLPVLAATPSAIQQFRRVRAGGIIPRDRLPEAITIEHFLPAGRNAPLGAPLTFSQLVDVLCALERTLLAEHFRPRIPTPLLAGLAVLDRQTFYFASCEPETALRGEAVARIAPPPAGLMTPIGLVCGGLVSVVTEVYRAATQQLLLASSAEMMIAVHQERQRLQQDARRVVTRCAS